MNIIGDNLGAWLAATIVALLSIFSDKILGRIRFSLNRADLRSKYFEELAVDLSTYIFWAEIFLERFQKGWIEPDDIGAIGGEVNGAITTLRKKEYLYLSWIKRYWGLAAEEQFSQVMVALKQVEDAIHAFNDSGNKKDKIGKLEKELDTLRNRVKGWLTKIAA
jgi:hypothetical protein